jgi:hypothetical protein
MHPQGACSALTFPFGIVEQTHECLNQGSDADHDGIRDYFGMDSSYYYYVIKYVPRI